MTESVTLRDRDRGSRSTGRKGFSPEINPVLLSFMSSMRVSRSVIPCGEMVRVPFRHSDKNFAVRQTVHLFSHTVLWPLTVAP